jgi:hypothetical protein
VEVTALIISMQYLRNTEPVVFQQRSTGTLRIGEPSLQLLPMVPATAH